MSGIKNEPWSNTLGGRLWYSISLSKFTQKEFAKTIGISERSLYRYIKNLSMPNVEIFIKMCKTFNVSSDYLLGLISDNND